jgi:AraC family transcriptional regulator of adaptative response/methylated-DNA-[protein]-cysteine methyltransferase
MVAAATDRAVCFLEFSDRRMFETQLRRMVRRLDATPTPGANPLLARLAGELEEYFAGRRRSFSAALETPGTPFQEAVWARLREIPSGTTRSYGEIAAELGRPGASRAVARAVGDNRIAILIPCHRVIGSDGSLTGYGGGLWRKKRLLEIEAGAAER